MFQKMDNLLVIEEIDEHRYNPFSENKKKRLSQTLQAIKINDFRQFRKYIKCIHRKERSFSNSKNSQKSLEKSLENLEKIEAEWNIFKKFSLKINSSRRLNDNKSEICLNSLRKSFTNDKNNKFSLSSTRFFTPKSSPKMSNMLQNYQKPFEVKNDKKPSLINEKTDRTKSFNTPFPIKEEIESCRTTTPRPVILNSISERRNSKNIPNIQKLKDDPKNKPPLREIKAWNFGKEKKPVQKPFKQVPNTIKKLMIGENSEKLKKIQKLEMPDYYKRIDYEKNKLQNMPVKHIKVNSGKVNSANNGDLNTQVQKLMDNLVKLKNDTNKLYNTYNTIKTTDIKQPPSPFESLYNEIITKLKKDSNDNTRSPSKK